MTEEQINRAAEFAKSKHHTIPKEMVWRQWGQTHIWMAMGHVDGENSELAPILYNAKNDIIYFFDASSGVFVLSEGEFVGYIEKIRNEEKKREQELAQQEELKRLETITQQEIDETCDDLLECIRLGTVRPEDVTPFENKVMAKKYGDEWATEMFSSLSE